jgi:plastocyanin
MRTQFTFLVLGIASLGLLVTAPPKAEAQFRNSRMFVSHPAAPVRAAMMPAFMPNRALFPNRTLFPNHAVFPNRAHFPNHAGFPNRVFPHRDFDHDFDHDGRRFSHWWSSPFSLMGMGYGFSGAMTNAYSGGIPYGYSPMSYGGSGYTPMSYGGSGYTPMSNGNYGSSQAAYTGDNSYAPSVAPAEEEDVVDVGIHDNYFRPARVTVSVGTTVRWTNRGHHGHAVTSDDDGWDSGELGLGGSYGHTFNRPGTYHYHCKFHPDEMRGVVIVK